MKQVGVNFTQSDYPFYIVFRSRHRTFTSTLRKRLHAVFSQELDEYNDSKERDYIIWLVYSEQS